MHNIFLFRTILLFLSTVFFLAIPSVVQATPGDTYNAHQTPATKPNSIQPTITNRRAQFTDTPVVPQGFQAVKISARLGHISALASTGTDLFVLDSAAGRILRLRDRDQNGEFEIRSEFLVGFNQASDLVVNEEHIFISDANGVWKIKIGTSLAATARPKNILPVAPNIYTPTPRPLALSPDGNLLYVGLTHSGNKAGTKIGTGQIAAIDLRSRKPSIYANGKWSPHTLAISSAGSLVAAVENGGSYFIAPVSNGKIDSAAGLQLMPMAKPLDLIFWNVKTYNKNWPQIWKQDLIIALSGYAPMIARAHNSFGNISPSYTAMIDGFSQTTIIQNRRKVWGQPSAMTILPNGDFIFAESNGRTLWRLEKLPHKPKIRVASPRNLQPPATASSAAKPRLNMGSTMQGSSIKNASMIGKHEELKSDKKAPKQYRFGTPDELKEQQKEE